MKNSNDTIEIRKYDLTICITGPQPLGSDVLNINVRLKYENSKCVHNDLEIISYFNADSYYKVLYRDVTVPN